MSVQNKYTRRGFLNRLGGGAAVTALTPFVPTMEADAQVGSPLRYLYWYTPVNPAARLVNPNLPNSEGPLQWRGANSPLNEMKHKMSLLRGLTNVAGYDTSSAGMQGGHKSSGVTMINGWAAKKNAQPGDTKLVDNNLGFHGRSSLDQWLAEKLRSEKNVDTPLTDIRMGYENRAHTNEAVWKSISYKDGAIRLRHQTPNTLFQQMFQFAGGGTTTEELNTRKSVLNNVYGSIKDLQRRLGTNDKMRLEQHINAIDEVERQLDASAASGGSCSIPDGLSQTSNNFDQALDAYIQLITIAFNCDMTRVAGAQWMSHLSGQGYRFLPESNPVSDRYHGVTHGNGPGSSAQKDAFINAIARHRAETFVKLMKSLDSITEGNGKTMLDNTILHWFIEVSKDHKWFDQFNVIAGGGGYFKMGIHDIVGSTSRNERYPQNMLLTSIVNAFGFPMEHYGDQKYNRGGLPSRVLV